MSLESARSLAKLGFDHLLHLQIPACFVDCHAALTVASALALYYYSHEPTYIRWSLLLCTKLLVVVSIITIRILEALPDVQLQSVIAVLSALILGLLTYTEHKRSIYPSSFFALILVTDIVHGAVLFYFEALENTHFGGAAVALKVGLISLHSISKGQSIIDDNLRRNFDDKIRAGLLGMLSYLSPNSISSIPQILYQSRVLFTEDGALQPELQPAHLLQQLKWAWADQRRLGLMRGGVLFMACMKAWRQALLPLMLSRLTITALRWVHPFVLRRVIETVESQYDETYALKELAATFAAGFAIFLASAAAEENFAHLMTCYLSRLRCGLIALQLDKLQRITDADAKKSARVALVSADVDGIVDSIPHLMMVPVSILEVGIGCSVLSQTIEASPLVLCLPFFGSSILNYLIRGPLLKHFERWKQSANRRIASTSRILQQLSAIKMLGLGPTICDVLQTLRAKELQQSKLAGFFLTTVTIPTTMSYVGIEAVGIGAAISSGYFASGMTAARVFPLLCVMCNITQSIFNIAELVAATASIGQCFNRIQSFLCLPDKLDCRTTYSSPMAMNSASHPPDVIRFNHTDLAAKSTTASLLRGVNIRLTQGSVSGVIGPHGAGKSTFLRAILGECEVLAGSIQVDRGDIGHCGEGVWFQDATIRDNIIGILPYDEQRYRSVIRACFLEQDFEHLPGGDEYVVNGSNLSDGQKRRITIARIAYARHSITLLDDVFRSLDIETAICILHQLCGRNGIFRQAGCTVVVVTSLPQCLEVVDQLILLDGLGHATLDRTYRHAPNRQRFETALRTLNINNNALLVVEKRQQNALYRYLQASSMSDSPQAGSIHRASDWELVLFAIASFGKSWAILGVFLIFCLGISENIRYLYLRLWVEAYPEDASLYLGYVLLCVSDNISAFMAYFVTWVVIAPRLSTGLYSTLVQTTSQSTLGFFEIANAGHLSNFFNEDSQTITRSVPRFFLRFLYGASGVAAVLVLILFGNRCLIASFPIVVALLVYYTQHFCPNYRDAQRLEIQKKAALRALFEETAAGLTQLSSSFPSERQLENGMNALAESQTSLSRALMVKKCLRFYAELFTTVLIAMVLAVALFTQASVTSAAVGVAYFGAVLLPRGLYEMVLAFGNMHMSLDAVARVLELKQQTPLEYTQSSANLPPNWPSDGGIELHNASAYYTTAVDAAPAALNISLSVQPGQHIGISGRSSSGKSSLFLMMLGFIRYEGMAKVDGIEISSVPPEILRSRLITITQEPVIFEGTVRANLLPLTLAGDAQCWRYMYGDAKDEELEELLKRLHIWIPLISKGGLDAMVDDVDYSKAELQLLCIARAILRQRETGTKVILVDDATNCLTMGKEQIANEVMSACFRGCTVLRISARQSGLEGVSAVIYLSRGTVVDPDQIGNESESELETDSDPEEES